jgi:hypothetical protein
LLSIFGSRRHVANRVQLPVIWRQPWCLSLRCTGQCGQYDRHAFHLNRERQLEAHASDGALECLGAFHSPGSAIADRTHGEASLVVEPAIMTFHEPLRVVDACPPA